MRSDQPKAGKKGRRKPDPAGGREAADGAGSDSREVIDTSPTAEDQPTELTLSAVGRREIAQGFLMSRDGDLGDWSFLAARRQALADCGRPGGPVFSGERLVGDTRQTSIVGLLRCGLHGICSVDAALRASERYETALKTTTEYLRQDPDNAVVLVTLTVPRAKTNGWGTDAQALWGESVELAKRCYEEFSAHRLRELKARWDLRGSLKVIERQYSHGKPGHYFGGKKAGCGVHLHVHALWYCRQDLLAEGELAVAKVIWKGWNAALCKVVVQARWKRPEAFAWVNVEDAERTPVMPPEMDGAGQIKGGVSVRFVSRGEEVATVLRYLCKELAFGSRKSSRSEDRSRSFSWGELLTLAGSPTLGPWAKACFRFHAENSAGERTWQWSYGQAAPGEGKRSFAAKLTANDKKEDGDVETSLDEFELGASATANAFGQARRDTKNFIRDQRLHKANAIEAEGMAGFAEDDRTQEEKREVLRRSREARLDGRAMYLAVVKRSRSKFVTERLARLGFGWSEELSEYVKLRPDDEGEL